jgi:hypothetical protein
MVHAACRIVIPICFLLTTFGVIPLPNFPLSSAQPAGKALGPLALVVGVNNYQGTGLDSLNYAVRDATDLSDELKRAGFDVRLLKNDQATKKGIETALSELLEKRQKGQMLLVALSGHGLHSIGTDGKEDAYFCPGDTDKGRNKNLLSLSTFVGEMGSRGTNLLLVDACRNDPKRGARNFVGNELTDKLPSQTAVLFSCAAGQASIETNRMYGEKSEKGHGVFFFHILEGLRGKAKNADGEVTWYGLVEYVKKNVNSRAKEWEPDQARLRADALGVTLVELKFQTPHLLNNLDESVVLVTARDLGSTGNPVLASPDFASGPVQITEAGAWIERFNTQYVKTKTESDRNEIRKKVQQFCADFIPSAAKLDSDVLIKNERVPRKSVTIDYDINLKTVSKPMSDNSDELNEFNFKTRIPNVDRIVWANGLKYTATFDTLKPTEKSAAAYDFSLARNKVLNWSTKELGTLKMKCEGNAKNEHDKDARHDLLDELIGVTPSDSPGSMTWTEKNSKIWTRLKILTNAMEKFPALFE